MRQIARSWLERKLDQVAEGAFSAAGMARESELAYVDRNEVCEGYALLSCQGRIGEIEMAASVAAKVFWMQAIVGQILNEFEFTFVIPMMGSNTRRYRAWRSADVASMGQVASVAIKAEIVPAVREFMRLCGDSDLVEEIIFSDDMTRWEWLGLNVDSVPCYRAVVLWRRDSRQEAIALLERAIADRRGRSWSRWGRADLLRKEFVRLQGP